MLQSVTDKKKEEKLEEKGLSLKAPLQSSTLIEAIKVEHQAFLDEIEAMLQTLFEKTTGIKGADYADYAVYRANEIMKEEKNELLFIRERLETIERVLELPCYVSVLNNHWLNVCKYYAYLEKVKQRIQSIERNLTPIECVGKAKTVREALRSIEKGMDQAAALGRALAVQIERIYSG